MLFDADGQKVFDKVRTQLATDDDFGTLSAALQAGTYTVVAVGHSSLVSATIKSPQMVQFTAKDGQKLDGHFCYCGEVNYRNNTPAEPAEVLRLCDGRCGGYRRDGARWICPRGHQGYGRLGQLQPQPLRVRLTRSQAAERNTATRCSRFPTWPPRAR